MLALLHRWLRIPYTLHVHHIRRPKKPVATYIFLHGIGNSAAVWDEIIETLPPTVRVISLDLLGFGQSAKPTWATYNAATQARSVAATLLSLGVIGKATLVGHSLGALVAIEVSKKYPLLVTQLILCSPPLYVADNTSTPLPFNADKLLKGIYRRTINSPDRFISFASFAMRYNLVNKSFNVTNENVHSYMTALEAMIINQTSYSDAKTISVPTHIFEGVFDPFVLHANLKKLTKSNPNVTLQTVFAGHEVRGRFAKAVIAHLKQDWHTTYIGSKTIPKKPSSSTLEHTDHARKTIRYNGGNDK